MSHSDPALSPFPSAWATKTVAHKFAGADLSYRLSHALFSSFDIDKGSLLLLKTLAQQVDLGSLKRVLDVGCGIGVLGLDVKKKNPALELVSQDRDTLAGSFTLENARRNGLAAGVTALPGLAFQDIEGAFDLIVSNLPAKAGAPVLTDFFARAGHYLTETGRCAVVIVHTLADWARQTLQEQNLDILLDEKGLDYTVFHFRGRGTPAADPFAPYLRDTVEAEQGKTRYNLSTCWGLPNFDSLDYQTMLALDFWEKRPVGGRVLFWNPGQGHLPVYAQALKKPRLETAILASRDTLALQAAGFNLKAKGLEPVSLPVSHFSALVGRLDEVGPLDGAVLLIDSAPEIPWAEEMMQALPRLLPAGARVLLAGTSTEIHRLLELRQGLIPTGLDAKYRGFRTVWLQRS